MQAPDGSSECTEAPLVLENPWSIWKGGQPAPTMGCRPPLAPPRHTTGAQGAMRLSRECKSVMMPGDRKPREGWWLGAGQGGTRNPRVAQRRLPPGPSFPDSNPGPSVAGMLRCSAHGWGGGQEHPSPRTPSCHMHWAVTSESDCPWVGACGQRV